MSGSSAARIPRLAKWFRHFRAKACGCRPASPPRQAPIGAMSMRTGSGRSSRIVSTRWRRARNRSPKPGRRSAPPSSTANGRRKPLPQSSRPTRSSANAPAGRELDVAVRSSATAEDLPDASFAGQQETFLNIRGERALLDACRRCYASLFTDRAISYRQVKGFDHMQVALSIGVQQMVRSDIGGSGVMFSIDTETGFDKVVRIDAAWGLGENVVQGAVDPDAYQVFKPLLADELLLPIVEKTLGEKAIKMIYASGENPTKNVPTSRPSAPPSCSAIRRSSSWPAGRRPSRPTTAARWTWNGRRTATSVTSSSSRRGRRPCSRAVRSTSSRPIAYWTRARY